MDHERLDSFPEFNLFFSPNWFSHQIADISPSGLCAFGCNDEVQLIDVFARRPITSLYIKTPSTDKMLKDINERKVTAVLVTDTFIIFTTVSGFLTIFEISKNNIICRFCDNVLQHAQISCIKELKPVNCELELMLTDLKNTIIFGKYKAGVIDQVNLERQGINNSTKYLEIINYKDEEQFYAKIMDNGSFNIWTSYFEDSVYNVDIGHIINTASFGIFDGLLIIAIISRKNRLIVCQVGLEKIFEDFLVDRKFVSTNGSNFRLLVNLELEIVSNPSSGAESEDKVKLRFHNRVIALNDQRIIVTSKDGHMYLTDIESLMRFKEDKLVMRPADDEFDNPAYEMLDENPHFKNIYFAKLMNNMFMSIGMDRLMSFWTISKHKIQYEFNVKCLGSKVGQVAVSPLEPNSFLLACNDSSMRYMYVGNKANRFYATMLWKNLERRNFRNLKFHPTELGLVSIISDRHISLMDVHAHVVLSEFSVSELSDGEVLFARWMKRSVLEVFIDSRLEKEVSKVMQLNKGYKPQNDPHSGKINARFSVVHKKYNRELDKEFMFVCYIQNRGFMVVDFNLGTTFALTFQIERFVMAVEVINLFEEFQTVIFLFGDKKGKLILVRHHKGVYDSTFLENVHNGCVSAIKFNQGMLLSQGSKQGSQTHGANPEPNPQKKMLIFDEVEIKKNEKARKSQNVDPDAAVRDALAQNEVPVKIGPFDLMVASGSLDRSIKILIIRNALKSDKLSFKNVQTFLTLRHRYRIDQIDWDPFDHDRFLTVMQKHAAVQVWTINPRPKAQLKQDEENAKRDDIAQDPYYVSNIRGHKGFITMACWAHSEKNMVLTASDDQSIKIWNLINIRCRQPPLPKKNETNDDDNEYTEQPKKQHHRDTDDRFKNEYNIKDYDQKPESQRNRGFGQDSYAKGGRNDYEVYNSVNSKLDNYKQNNSRKVVRYELDSDQEEDDQDSHAYYQKSEKKN
jgi:hypothetical protein